MTGLAVVTLQRVLHPRLSARQAHWIPWLIFLTLLGWNGFAQRDKLFCLTPEQVCARVYPDNPFVAAPLVAQYLREYASTNAQVAIVGSEPEIYFDSRLRSATSFLYTYPLMEAQPYALAMQHEMIREIEAAKPEYLVYAAFKSSWLAHTNSSLEILYWKNQYTREFYERVGIIEQRPSGEIVSHWNADARIFDPANNHHFAIYRRKAE
jgi:hypothetical protein